MTDHNNQILPFFIPHLGCPYQCIFCNQHHVSGEDGYPKAEEITKAIDHWEEESLPEIAFYGGSFSGLSFAWQKYFLTPAFSALQRGKIKGIRISTRPDYINSRVLSLLSAYGVKTVELGVQSMDDEVLRKSQRGHCVQDVIQAIFLLKEQGFIVGVQLMPGLPGDTREKSIRGAGEISRLGPHMVRIYPTLVLKDTPLHKLFLEESYHPLSLQEAINTSRDMLAVFRYFNIAVIRIGLQPTKEIAEGRQVASGPFHPAFGELVESALFKEQMIMALEDFLTGRRYDELILWVSPQDCSLAAGHKRDNIHFIKNRFQIEKIKIKGTNSFDRGTVGISPMDGRKPERTVSQTQFLGSYVSERLMANGER